VGRGLHSRAAGGVRAAVLDGSPYRGELAFAGSDSGLAVINALSIEDYLLGVVPLEMGDRPLATRRQCRRRR
jgi:peptidoglycan hydrolase-like amidase